MTRQYLYPQTRKIEMTMALFAAGFGMNALYLKSAFGNAGLSWAGIEDGRAVAQLLVGASIAHGIGIRANGRLGPLSPLLRSAAMGVFTYFFGALAFAGAGTSATYTYAVIAVGMCLGARNAAVDLLDALKGLSPRWTH